MESNKSGGFKALNTIAFSLMGGLTMFAGVVYFLSSSDEALGSSPIFGERADLLVVGGFSLMCLVMSRIISEKLLGSISKENRQDYASAMEAYRSGTIVRLALLEGAGLAACVFSLLTGNLSLLFITGFMVVMMWTRRPTETEFAEWRG